MIPELTPTNSMLLFNPEADERKQYPIERDAGELVELPSFTPVAPWQTVVAVTPRGVRSGAIGKDSVPIGYQRWILGVNIPYANGWPDALDADGSIELPFALLQKQDVLVAYVFMGRVAGIEVELNNDHWNGMIVLHVTRLKRLVDRVV